MFRAECYAIEALGERFAIEAVREVLCNRSTALRLHRATCAPFGNAALYFKCGV